MRPSAAAAAVLAVAVTLPLGASPARGAAPAGAVSLGARLSQLVDGFPGGAAIWVGDPALTPPTFARDMDREIVAASLYKLAILAAVEDRVERRELRYADTIVIEPDDITADGSFEPVGTEMTIDDALEAMITLSDNGTAVHFWRTLGGPAVNAFLKRQGIAGLHIATDAGDDNRATARAVATYFGKLGRGELVSRGASARMLARLERQQINDRLPAQLPEGTRVAHKTGNLPGLVHDAGIVFTARSQRVVVAMTWGGDPDGAAQLIAHLAAAVYGDALAAPATARYRVPLDPQYVEHNAPFVMEAVVENSGDEPWEASTVRLVWELRSASNAAVARSPAPIDLGDVPAGGSVAVPIAFTAPARSGDHRLLIGLVDRIGRDLAKLGVATATVDVRVHLPPAARVEVRIPGFLHRGEASLVEVAYTALEASRADDHFLTLAWRLVDPATDRAVARGRQALGLIRASASASGSFFAPLVAPNVRGTYRLEYEITERGFLAGVTRSRTVEVLPRRTFADDVDPRTQRPRPSGRPPRSGLVR